MECKTTPPRQPSGPRSIEGIIILSDEEISRLSMSEVIVLVDLVMSKLVGSGYPYTLSAQDAIDQLDKIPNTALTPQLIHHLSSKASKIILQSFHGRLSKHWRYLKQQGLAEAS